MQISHTEFYINSRQYDTQHNTVASTHNHWCNGKAIKGKSVPLQAWRDPEPGS